MNTLLIYLKTTCKLFILLSIPLLFFSCNKNIQHRETIDLSGYWQFQTNPDIDAFNRNNAPVTFTDSIKLPGTTDLRKKGVLNTDTTTMHYNRVYKYEGPAWYQKTVVIPEGWENKHISLIMERTKSSKLWVDNQYIGQSAILQSPQQYNLTKYLTPGKHTLTLCIDNRQELTPYGHVHIYADDTQTNWNGIIGRFVLEASEKTRINNVQVYPNIEKGTIAANIFIDNPLRLDNIDVELQIKQTLGGKTTYLPAISYLVNTAPKINLEYELGGHMALWDEYKRPVYTLNAIISTDQGKDNYTVNFGMRNFTTNGTQFEINGRTTFLRGKHDACVFPLTGHPPMTKAGWLKYYNKAKQYGINHVRFHSWCPPKAAFEAADEAGIYLQVELPFWGGMDTDSIAEMQKAEGYAMLKSYANHPSFVMFSPGNEIWSGHDRVENYMTELKEYDNRPLYTIGSNCNIGYTPPRGYADFFVGARTPSPYGDTIMSHTRLTHAFADSKGGARLNTQTPSTNFDFAYPVSQINMPIVSHEIGQYQIYPDYDEIDKYTGVVDARNLKVFKQRLEEKGMGQLDSAFQKASGAWSALCYKAEMEAALRTEGFGGFQLLDLQDFPGQGTALVGILDAFMDSKNVISAEKWRQSCNDVTLLLMFDKYCWTYSETFTANVKIANYSNKKIKGKINWTAKQNDGTILDKGTIGNPGIKAGNLNNTGTIGFSLSPIKKATQINIHVEIEETNYSNDYTIWAYPPAKREEPADVFIASKLDSQVINMLKKGHNILLMPTEEIADSNVVDGHFPPEFWNYGMFKQISENVGKPVSPGTLGLLMNPEHPVFNHFPTDYHTNWQWFSLVKASKPLKLNFTEHSYLPIIQVIDNLERNNKYGFLFEFNVEKGKLLVCMANLNSIMDKPEAAQFYNSIIKYMESDAFQPKHTIETELLSKNLK